MPFEVYDATYEVTCRAWLVQGVLVVKRSEIMELVSVDDLLTGNVDVVEGTFKGEFVESDDWDEMGHHGTLWAEDGNAYFINAGYLNDPSEPPDEADTEGIVEMA